MNFIKIKQGQTGHKTATDRQPTETQREKLAGRHKGKQTHRDRQTEKQKNRQS